MYKDLAEAVTVLEDCLQTGDNAEYSLATIASDYGLNTTDLAATFFVRYGQTYLTYTGVSKS